MDPYHDENGKLLFWVVKLRYYDGSKGCPQITYCEGPKKERKWCAKRMDPPYPLMGLDMLALFPDRYAVVVSGEACRTELEEFAPKMVAVTWLGGDKCVKKTDWSPLYGRKMPVIVYGDDDKSGREAARDIIKILEANRNV